MSAQPVLNQTNAQALWHQLVEELADVFDAHGVCAAVATTIAQHADTTVVVAISNPLRSHYDVWIAKPDGYVNQTRWDYQKSALNRLCEGGRATHRDKLGVPANDLVTSELWQLPHESVLAVPLPYPPNRSQVTLPSLICIIDPPQESELMADNLESLAAQITVYLDRAFLRQRTDQQAIEFGIVSDISYSITSTLDLEEIFLETTDAVRRALGVESISIGLTDIHSNEIVFNPSLMGPLFRKIAPIRLQIGQGVAGWVALHGKPTIVNDPYQDQRFFSRPDKQSGFTTQSLLCVPLLAEKRVIGVIEAVNKHNGHCDDNDLRLLQAISGPLTVAIDNARLHSDVVSEKRRVETILASMSEGLLTATKDGWITAVNEAFLILLKIPDSELVGKRLEDVIKTQPATFANFIQKVLRADQSFPHLACDLHQGNGEYVPVLVSGTTVPQGDGEANELILVFSDLRQIREVERMRDDFFNNIVHELHTPLATVLMYARLLREGKAKGDAEKTRRFLGVIERETYRLQKMVRQMLQLARLEARELNRSTESTDLISLFDQLLPPLADQATEKGLAFRQHIPNSLPAVKGNEDTLHLVFRNLIENSIKFTYAGKVGIEARTDIDTITVEVSDDGIGMPPQALRPSLTMYKPKPVAAIPRSTAARAR